MHSKMIILIELSISISQAKPNTQYFFFFFFNDTATTEIYTLSLHDALPILRCDVEDGRRLGVHRRDRQLVQHPQRQLEDRKSTRLNSSHSQISYAVFCLKKKKKMMSNIHRHIRCT